MRGLSVARRVSAMLALGALVACMLVGNTAFADVITRTEGENIPSGDFTGTWIKYTNEPLLSGLWGIYSHTVGDTLDFPFTGTGIDWIGVKAVTCGSADVWVDSEAPTAVNLYIPTSPPEYNVTLWSRTGLTNSAHVLHVRVATDANVNVDAVDVHTPDPAPVSTSASAPWTLALLFAVGIGGVSIVARRKRSAA